MNTQGRSFAEPPGFTQCVTFFPSVLCSRNPSHHILLSFSNLCFLISGSCPGSNWITSTCIVPCELPWDCKLAILDLSQRFPVFQGSLFFNAWSLLLEKCHFVYFLSLLFSIVSASSVNLAHYSTLSQSGCSEEVFYTTNMLLRMYLIKTCSVGSSLEVSGYFDSSNLQILKESCSNFKLETIFIHTLPFFWEYDIKLYT